jgi:hypothetical protein
MFDTLKLAVYRYFPTAAIYNPSSTRNEADRGIVKQMHRQRMDSVVGEYLRKETILNLLGGSI